ncbi:MAG: hypothetical protein MI919_18560, partial [Holophagales bacterium]|nr:hypothetical protein [Holophagales bacterium]
NLPPMSTTLLVHTAATLYMCGLIWFVQVVHYPLFPFARGDGFRAFAAEHQRRTGWVVGPPMLAEAASTVLLVAAAPASVLAWAGAALLASIWLSTALAQVPCHRRLAEGFDAATVRRLVASNAWRTLAWTARGGIALAMLG